MFPFFQLFLLFKPWLQVAGVCNEHDLMKSRVSHILSGITENEECRGYYHPARASNEIPLDIEGKPNFLNIFEILI